MNRRRVKIEDGGWEEGRLPQENAKVTKTGIGASAFSALFRGHERQCQPRLRAFALTLVLSTLLSPHPTFGQIYAIDWHTIDGGGGTSTGGVYSVSGTIGQPDAGGPMTNGQYSVTGGFWVLPQAVQTPGAPLLTIAPAGSGQAAISWTPDTPGFVLQETLSLSSTNWVDSPTGSTNPVVVPATVPAKFYRLFKP